MRVAVFVICVTAAIGGTAWAAGDRSDFVRPLDIPFPEHAPYDPQIATLGKMLFFDPRVSGAQNMSCASCHNPSFGWEAPVGKAVGAANVALTRHANTVINSAWIAPLFWDGRAPDLENQSAGPITNEQEMNATFEQVVDRLSEVEGYALWFDRLFPDRGMTEATILTSIATYERTIVSGWSPFDRWVEGEEDAISASAKRGFDLFTGKAQCANCHSGWNFTDNLFHDIGVFTDDVGRAEFEPENPQAAHAFKTPGLRNITLRAPYMHNGSMETLEEVLFHYASGGMERASRSPLMQPFDLSDEETADLLAFLESLSEEETEVPTPILPAN
ncbi:cytochrome-c peroxidase [Amaricoccus macauensis]|uniref:cytochrome-c peroxidase n=1 Tax=Amaricoccus macauensis TaxID=57001 RepID=UPI003C7ED8FE